MANTFVYTNKQISLSGDLLTVQVTVQLQDGAAKVLAESSFSTAVNQGNTNHVGLIEDVLAKQLKAWQSEVENGLAKVGSFDNLETNVATKIAALEAK